MVAPTYPGVYIEEVPSDVRTIVGVSTSVTAFVGSFIRGPEDTPVSLSNWGDFEREFGGLSGLHEESYQVQQFFRNGGSRAWVVRVAGEGAVAATADLPGEGGGTALTATAGRRFRGQTREDPGRWAENVQIVVDYVTSDPTDTTLFNMTVNEIVMEGNRAVIRRQERYANVVNDEDSPDDVVERVNENSKMIQLARETPARPAEQDGLALAGGNDGAALAPADLQGSFDARTGLFALRHTDGFNILCVPGAESLDDPADVYDTALGFCETERAFLLVDTPEEENEVQEVIDWVDALNLRRPNAAVYYPRVRVSAGSGNRMLSLGPSGTMAGIYAATDASRGVWKAPAGLDAVLRGVRGLAATLTDSDSGMLNPQGINALRMFPIYGRVAWGARTLEGADALASQWKHIPVRRLTLFLEESLYRGTQWVVFEPNDEPLWSQIRLNVGTFVHDLFRQGAFQGTSPREAYFVKCDAETTTQSDINRGIVNILVGFAPVKPAEFVMIRIQQLAGEVQT